MKSGYIVRQLAGTLLFFSVIFLSAGRLDYRPGVIYVSIGVVMFILSLTAFRIDPELYDERSNPGVGTKKWDKVILGLSFLMTLSMYVVAGLDSGRFLWSPSFYTGLTSAGIILTIAGQLLFLIAQKQNKFFSSTVRIQTERSHTVCDTGLYRIVRHPAYLGSVIQAAGFPLLFGSVWSIIPAGVLVILLLIRTSLEDKTLKNNLIGYMEYSGKTRNKIFPYLW